MGSFSDDMPGRFMVFVVNITLNEEEQVNLPEGTIDLVPTWKFLLFSETDV